jgi:Zn-dependent M16 (insulinase) family peptidase
MRSREPIVKPELPALSRLARVSSYTAPVLMLSAAILSFITTSLPRSIHGFVLKEVHSFPSLGISAHLYQHSTLGCQFLHIESPDRHNFFATTFRTTPTDSSGVFHAIQHLINQGSESYPIPDVFTELRKRTIATSLQSFWSFEWTTYQFSTTNTKDFFNLLDVHLDAVFHPLLSNESFWAECHRLEFDQPRDSSTPLHHSGTLYRETVNSRRRPNVIFASRIKRELFPDSPLGHDFSGLPAEIQKLTRDNVRQAHSRFYHPSNALFVHYGSLTGEAVLRTVGRVVCKFGRRAPPPEEAPGDRWSHPVSVECEGPSDDTGDLRRVKASSSWVAGDLMNVSDVVDLEFLAILLTESTVSPLYGGLIKSGTGSRLINTGYFPKLRTPYFSIGVDGFNPAWPEFNETILALLNQEYGKGFSQNRVLSLLNQHEIRQKTITSSQGYKFWRQIISSWAHGVHPFSLLDASWEIERLQRLLAVQPRYFEMIMKQRIIDNPHRLDLEMRGNTTFIDREIAKEKQHLLEIKGQLTPQGKRDIVAIADALQRHRISPKPLHLLPSIEVRDLSPTHEPVTFTESDNVTIVESPVNGIVYVDIKAKIPLDAEYIEDLPLLKYVLPHLGSGELDENQFSVQEQLLTGGFKCDWKIRTAPDDPSRVDAYFIVSGSALSRNVESLFSLLEKVTLKPDLRNRERIAELLSMVTPDFDAFVDGHGPELCSKYAAAGFSKAAVLEEFWSGFTAIHRTRQLVREGDWKSVALRIEKVYYHVFRRATFAAIVHTNEPDHFPIRAFCTDLLRQLNGDDGRKEGPDNLNAFLTVMKQRNKVLLTNEKQFGYITVMAANCAHFEANQSVTFAVLASLIQSEFLQEQGADKESLGRMFCNFEPMTGVMSFVTLNDHYPGSVITTFGEAMEKAASGPIHRAMIERAIIQVIAKLDQPTAPSERGMFNFYYNVSAAVQQVRRTEILHMKAEAIVEAAGMLKAAAKRFAIMGVSQELLIPTDFEAIDVFEDSEPGLQDG